MSFVYTVNELRDFVIENYTGSLVTANIEDLRFISQRAFAVEDRTFYHRSKNLRFVYLTSNSLLAMDESNPLVKKLAETYIISLATPPLINFEFDLAFVRKNVSPAPPANKLSEALQQIGYSGPRVTN